MPSFAAALRHLSLGLRQLGALLTLVLSVRLLWMSGHVGLTELAEKSASASQGSPLNSNTALPTNQPLVQGAHRPNLEELNRLVGEDNEPPIGSATPDGPRLRRILIDLGPERSEVFLRGQRVGQTPYGGQIACTLNEKLKIQVLPARGVPLQRTVTCRGETLLVRE